MMMPGSKLATRFRFWLWLIHLIGVIVPRRLRADWKQEWEAELCCRELLLADWDKLNWRTRLDLLWRSLGALLDALWMQTYRWEDDMFQDLRYGVRVLLKQPGFSAVVILVLALGIGATTAIFSVVNGVLLRPLPYPEPDRLMMVFPTSERGSNSINTVTGPDYVEWSSQSQTCAEMAAHTGAQPGNLTGGAEPDRVRIARVTGSLFATLEVAPALGRTFLPDETGRLMFNSDTGATGNTAVILSYGLWQRRFGADPSVIGKAIKVEGDACAVIGVMPDGFNFPDEAEAWLPVALNPKRNNAYLQVIARLQSGATPAEAQTELTAIALRPAPEVPQDNRDQRVSLIPLHEQMVENVRPSLLMFLGAVSFVLLIACANVANLLMARAATRQKEMVIRSALGASPLRIVRQLLTESVLLAVLGGSLGLLLAFVILNFLLAGAPQEIPRLGAIRIDRWVLGFTLLLSILTGILFGLAPALQSSRPDLNSTLKEGGASVIGGTARHRLRGLLVVTEVSLALMLLIGAGLLLKSFTRLRETKLGFNPDHVLTASLTLPEADYPTAAQVKTYYRQALARLAANPGVQAASIVNALPLGKNGARIQGDLSVEGDTAPRSGAFARKLAISPDYFRALGIPLLRGRTFDERDTAESPGVLVISEGLARRLWPDQEALGKRINIGFSGETWREVVGVVGDVKQQEIGERSSAAVYQPYLQVLDSRRWMLGDLTFVIRTAGQPQSFAGDFRSELQAVDKQLPLYDLAPMEKVIAQKVADPRFYMLLLGSFSALALILAAAGIYGVISYAVTQRTHEIGIRMALGANVGDVLKLVIGQGMKLVLAGLAIGLGGALALTRVLAGFLYQVSVTDPGTFALLSVLLMMVSLLACYLPARRATRVDPMVALRYE
jgi:putative ABC transport system permease protein